VQMHPYTSLALAGLSADANKIAFYALSSRISRSFWERVSRVNGF
jgi:hypothetical protein